MNKSTKTDKTEHPKFQLIVDDFSNIYKIEINYDTKPSKY